MTLAADVLVTVVINNHNYARFLRHAVDSALAQTHGPVQVVVVDDGSTDGSVELLDGYRDVALVLCKRNGGQASAFNAAHPYVRGQVVVFLDADDVLHQDAAARVAASWTPGTSKISWPLAEIDATGLRTGAVVPRGRLPEGDLLPLVLAQGADCYVSPPCSGNAWSRDFLTEVLPVPELEYRRGADGFLITLAPLFGHVRALPEVLGAYRVHGSNQFASGTLEERTRGALDRHEVRQASLLAALAGRRVPAPGPGEAHRMGRWATANPYLDYLRGMEEDLRALRACVPRGAACLLVDDGAWGTNVSAGIRILPFTSRGGVFDGPPRDDLHAKEELRRARADGVRHVAITSGADWHTASYPALATMLSSEFEVVAETRGLRVHQEIAGAVRGGRGA